MILVFDLDDTLYDEITFVHSGFKNVALFMEAAFRIPSNDSYKLMIQLLNKLGRSRVFQEMLSHFNIYSKTNVKKCLSVYRSHKPDIRLFEEAEACLRRFEHLPIYIVTDGNKMVQNNKLLALGLYQKVKFCFVTHRYGLKNAKPSPHCFLKICMLEKVRPEHVVYIADNPHKDFVGIKKLGFKTVRVLTGSYRDLKLSEEFEAGCTINSLSELSCQLVSSL